MVTTYSTRLLNLPRLVNSNSRRKYVEDTSNGDSNGGHGNGKRKNHPAIMSPVGSKRKRPPPGSGRFYAHVPPHHGHGDSTAAKRRRQREEWQFAAATFQQALKEAGRPPASIILSGRRALPGGSADAGGARVVLSSEFDREEGDDQQVERRLADEADEEATQVVDDPCSYDDVSSMHMIAGLIQSTRGYYSFDTGDGAPPSPVLADEPDRRRATASRAFVGYHAALSNSETAPSEDSTWTPSGPSDALDDNRRKDVDDDNRSDGQSSCPGSADGGEEEGSLSGEGPGARSPRSEGEGAMYRAAFSIVG